ncbi:ABC-2 family transporter protein [Tautonia plasticadhaerens]|uniref:ABC-2 family transporter protein n=2 Tax=Tautonia plasticadhaerens TaxID=2527974 RepID=A0A518H580_9BACT|nr:ABC-2 family transporter protein [Tautonia plasticadhaerens]
MALLTIAFKQLGETRWSLIASTLAFFSLAILWDWGISAYQYPPEPETEPASEVTRDDGPDAGSADDPEGQGDGDGPDGGRRRRPPGGVIYSAFGVPNDRIFAVSREDSPTLLMQVAIANHPLIFLAVLGWAISRASAAVAGEIERGTLDLTLSRPVRRSTYLLAQILATAIAFALLGLALAGGHLASGWIFRLNARPGPLEYLPMVGSIAGLGLAVFGYTLPISAADLSRARAGILGLGITLGGIAALIFARQYEDYEWVADLSAFQYHGPVGLTLEGTREQYLDLATLYGVFAAGSILALVLFNRRDLPSNSG